MTLRMIISKGIAFKVSSKRERDPAGCGHWDSRYRGPLAAKRLEALFSLRFKEVFEALRRAS